MKFAWLLVLVSVGVIIVVAFFAPPCKPGGTIAIGGVFVVGCK